MSGPRTSKQRRQVESFRATITLVLTVIVVLLLILELAG